MAIVKRNGSELTMVELSTDQLMFLEDHPYLRNNPAKFWDVYQESFDKKNKKMALIK